MHLKIVLKLGFRVKDSLFIRDEIIRVQGIVAIGLDELMS